MRRRRRILPPMYPDEDPKIIEVDTEDAGRDVLQWAIIVIGAVALVAALTLRNDEPKPAAPCSQITLSTPDGKRCFPKHYDRSKVPADSTGIRDEGAR